MGLLSILEGSSGRTIAGDFDARSEFLNLLEEGVRRPIDATLAEIEKGVESRPSLDYLHTLVPHHPWHYLPDGRRYPYVVGVNPASVGGGWNNEEFLVAQSMQRHLLLLQVGYAIAGILKTVPPTNGSLPGESGLQRLRQICQLVGVEDGVDRDHETVGDLEQQAPITSPFRTPITAGSPLTRAILTSVPAGVWGATPTRCLATLLAPNSG